MGAPGYKDDSCPANRGVGRLALFDTLIVIPPHSRLLDGRGFAQTMKSPEYGVEVELAFLVTGVNVSSSWVTRPHCESVHGAGTGTLKPLVELTALLGLRIVACLSASVRSFRSLPLSEVRQ